ncbi:MAG TPA: hypothetical protein VE197_18110, partial [Mycobacterium sp.]|nr:hypothetical protein [Mycobacterium sp.]
PKLEQRSRLGQRRDGERLDHTTRAVSRQEVAHAPAFTVPLLQPLVLWSIAICPSPVGGLKSES